MYRISPNFIYAFILAISRLGLLPVIFHKGALAWYGKLTLESAHAWIF